MCFDFCLLLFVSKFSRSWILKQLGVSLEDSPRMKLAVVFAQLLTHGSGPCMNDPTLIVVTEGDNDHNYRYNVQLIFITFIMRQLGQLLCPELMIRSLRLMV